MIPLTVANQQAQTKPTTIPRDFIEIRARSKTDNSAVTEYLWSGVENITHTAKDPFTGTTASRTWQGAGNLIAVSAVTRVSNLTIQRVTINMSSISTRVNDLMRAYHVKYSTVILYRGFIDPTTGLFADAAFPRFVGQVDNVEIKDGAEGEESITTMTVKSNLQDLKRSNPATRSDAWQRKRLSTDSFRKYCAWIGDRQFNWGRE